MCKPNLGKKKMKEQAPSLHQLRKDKDRVILTADKGVAMVVLDKEDYINKAKELLNTPAYKEIPKDPTNKIKAQLITKHVWQKLVNLELNFSSVSERTFQIDKDLC